jgi:hypothetical protein
MKRLSLFFLSFVSAQLILTAAGTTRVDAKGHKNVYLAIRTDGLAGSGAECDPYDASTAAKYTWLLTTLQPDYIFHYAPGIYETYGWMFASRKTAGTGCKHYGAGIDRTIVRLVGASNGPGDGTVFASDYNIRADGFELHDLTIDCNAAAQPKWSSGPSRFVTAINTRGSNITIQRVKVVRFGTRSVGTECFPVFIASYKLPGTFENCVVEECEITKPETGNMDGVSTITVAVFEAKAVGRNLVACKNYVDLAGNDFLYSHGPYARLTENNFMKGCSDGFYAEPVNILTARVIVRRNVYLRCANGVTGQAHTKSMMRSIFVEGNTFADCGVAVRIAADDRDPHFGQVVVRGNRFQKSDGGLSRVRAIQITSTQKAAVSRNVLDASGKQVVFVRAARATVKENRTSGGALVNCTFNNVSK